MENENLRESLEKLHLGLLRFSTNDKSLQLKRDSLAAHIREALDQESLEDYHISLKEILSEEIVAFEEKHPQISNLMSSVENVLSSIGL